MNSIQVVLAAANPRGTTQLQLDEEVRRIESELAQSAYTEGLAGRPGKTAPISIRSVWAARLGDLVRNVAAFQPSVIHFSGHGEGKHGLVMVGENGRPLPVSSTILHDVLAEFSATTRLVVLNACHSAVQVEEIRRVIDCVIGMNSGITDQGAALFAAALYSQLALGSSVGRAFRLAKAVMAAQVPGDGDMPCLQSREGVNPDEIYLTSKKGTQHEGGPSLAIAIAGYSRPSFREFLMTVLVGDADLEAFCGDFFPHIKSMFGSEMSRITKVNLLLDREDGERILGALKESCKARFDRFQSVLRKAG